MPRKLKRRFEIKPDVKFDIGQKENRDKKQKILKEYLEKAQY